MKYMRSEPIQGNESVVAYVKPVENFLDRIHNRSRKNPNVAFKRLFRALTWPKLLVYAALRVLGNTGAYTPGVDGITKGIFLRTFKHQIAEIRKIAKSGYNSLAVKRHYIPKLDGSRRPLGIPALRDRVLQEAVRMILEAIFEPSFLPSSTGFRTGYSTKDAIKYCWTMLQLAKKMQYVLEFDIRKFFDNVNHETLYKLLAQKIHDKQMRLIIWRFMRAGVMENGKIQPCKIGIPQGGVISPILANIYLHEFDKFMWDLAEEYNPLVLKERTKNGVAYRVLERNRWSKNALGTLGYIRYADDGVAFWNGKLQDLYEIKAKCGNFLHQKLTLELSDSKTVITDVENGFKFLGFYCLRKKTADSLKNNGMTQKNAVVDVPKESVKKTHRKITDTLRQATVKGFDIPYSILLVNRQLDAFYNYFRGTTYSAIRWNGMHSHAMTQFCYYLKRKGYGRREIKKMKRRIDGRITYGIGKYNLRTPPKKDGVALRLVKRRYLGGKLDLYSSRFMDRCRKNKVTRLHPNDPLVPIDANWRQLRLKVLARDGGKCVYCSKPATEVDHILTKEEAKCNGEVKKRDTAEYLRSVCRACHLKRHGKKWSWSTIMEMIDRYNGCSAGVNSNMAEVPMVE